MNYLLMETVGTIEWGNVVLIGIIVGLVAAALSILGVVLAYRRKNRSPSYPLDQFTDLHLTEQADRYLYTRTTTRTINRGKK